MQYGRVHLSGSTNGRPIAVAAIASPGTTIHTGVTGTTSFDEVFLFATNIDTVDRTLTIEFGGTSTSDKLQFTVPPQCCIPILPGLNINNGLVVKAFADVANKVNLAGYINRITP